MMRGQPRIRSAALALAVAALAGCAHSGAGGAQASGGALEARQASFLAAMGERGTERLVTHFAEDAVLHVANMPEIRGRAAIRQFYANVFRFLASTTATVDSVRLAPGGDMAFSTGRVTNVFGAGERRTEFAGKFLLVWERRGGEWMVAVYAVSSDAADPGR